MHNNYLREIDFSKHKESLSDIIDMLMCKAKENEPELYKHIEGILYEDAYGKVINERMAQEWVREMSPVGMHWTMEETTNAMRSLGYSINPIEFYVVANMMYNDYYNIVNEDETLALRLAKDWLSDSDSKAHKLYEYWKHIAKK